MTGTIGNIESAYTVLTKDPAQKFLIAGDALGFLYFHDLKSGILLNKIKAHQSAVNQLQFNSTGKLLISTTFDGEIKIYDFSKEKIIQAIYSPDYTGIHFVLFSIADGFIYFNGNNRLYKTRSDLTQKVDMVFSENDTIKDAVITSDRSALIYACGGKLKIVNTRTDQITQELSTGINRIEKIALVKDSLLATWSQDGTIYYWKYNLGQVETVPSFFLKAGNPTSMSFSDDGRFMSSGNIGNWARVWKPMERKIIQELFAHTKTVTSTCFGINSHFVFTAGMDGKLILWRNDTLPPSIVDTIKTKPVVQELIKPTVIDVATEKSEIVIDAANIPRIISGRNVISNQKIETTSSEIKIFVFDNSYNDGDTMSLFFNGIWILDHYGVTKIKKEIKLQLTPNTNNYLVLFANNLGKKPPNTAAIEFQDEKSKRIFRLSSDLKSCSAINFYYKK